MAEFRPSEAQVAAIHEEGNNILVSAGAGSGKTTVLVERVLRMLIEEKTDIDSLIVVTFTRAAASHMKEKIYSRIRAALSDPDLSEEQKEHLKHQMMRVFSAKISTIDALCMDIVREHFQDVDIDPAFRVADEGEIRLLKQEVLETLIEKHYQDPDDAFLDFVEYYTDKNDARIEDIITTLYEYSQSHPDPKRWILSAIRPYLEAKKLCEGGFEAHPWIEELGDMIRVREQALLQMAEQGLLLSREEDGPAKYEPLFEEIVQDLRKLDGAFFDQKPEIYKDLLRIFSGRLPSVRKTDADEDLKALAKGLYDSIKEEVKKLSETLYFQPLEQCFLDMADCAKVAKTIAKLVLEYSRMLQEEKKTRLIADFSDIAHFALDVLRSEDDEGNVTYTKAADSIAQATREIIVDEYQDTNRMQDALIDALSAARFGRPNVFMVGDVKQSIYAFRLACPDLFQEKYDLYKKNGKEERDGSPSGPGRLIILGDNYRSRSQVVDFINLVFEKIMIPEVGGIDYQDGNRMIPGAGYPPLPEPDAALPEILFINGSGKDGRTAEAYEIARKIEMLAGSFPVKGEDGNLRPAAFSDIAILTRTANHPELEKMLTDRHIPVKKSSSKGFFASFEVRLALNLLRIIDNPLQNIPFAAVLLSPLTSLSASDLARIRAERKEEPFYLYEAVKSYAVQQEDEAAASLRTLLSWIEEYREKACGTGTRKLLEDLFETTGLSAMCAAMTYGEGRRANLEFLKTLADSYSKTSYTGLFSFIRYIEAIQKADLDFAGADPSLGTEDAVTMMTIHKSKGLEFPIVIVADCGRNIRDLDSGAPVVMDDVFGLGLERRDAKSRIKKKTLMMHAVEARKKNSMFAEEIRLLYVAMSRAKEKLILTSASQIAGERREQWERGGAVLPPNAVTLLKDGNYVYLIQDALMAAARREDVMFRRKILQMEDVETERAFEVFDETLMREQIEAQIQKASEDGKEADALAKEAGLYHFAYPYLAATTAPVKQTASQMEKHYEPDSSEDAVKEEVLSEEAETLFRKRGFRGLSGAERGNVYHKVMEHIDYGLLEERMSQKGEPLSAEELAAFSEEQITNLSAAGHLSETAKKAVDPKQIAQFLASHLGKRMRKAFLDGALRREQQFVMRSVIDGNPEGLMQGIIDALFVEEDEAGKHVVLVDYKTDRNRTEEFLKDQYCGQQAEYAKACEAALQLPVTEKILYSFELGKAIYL